MEGMFQAESTGFLDKLDLKNVRKDYAQGNIKLNVSWSISGAVAECHRPSSLL